MPPLATVDPAEPARVEAAASQAKAELYTAPPPAAPAGELAPVQGAAGLPPPDFDLQAEVQNWKDALAAGFRAVWIWWDPPSPRLARLLRGGFERADQLASGLADRMAKESAGKYGSKLLWAGVAGALLRDVLTDIGREKVAAEEKKAKEAELATPAPAPNGAA